MRRTAVAFLASLGLHAALLAGAAWATAGRAVMPNVRVVPFTLTEVRELPLRTPPRARKPRAKADVARASRSVKSVDAARGPEARAPERPAGPAPGAPAAPEARRRGDVSAYGPEGSSLVAILRVDRLRAGPAARPYVAAVDELLRLLPDRQRLLEGTGLDLYRDFDALLVATPNPLDATATFLAARHKVGDAALRAALGRGARAGGRAIAWRRQRGGWVGVRRSSGSEGAPDRDDRLFLLPAPGLLVIASPAYAKLLLDGNAAAPGRAPGAGTDAGGAGPGDWSALVARIDAEDGAVPEDAVFVATATNLLRPGAIAADTGARGGGAEGIPPPRAPAVPTQVSLLAGNGAAPYLEVRAEFQQEDEARASEAQWPAWKRELLANPLVLFARVDPLLSRTELERDGRTLVARTPASSEELLRLLRMAAGFAARGVADELQPVSGHSP